MNSNQYFSHVSKTFLLHPHIQNEKVIMFWLRIMDQNTKDMISKYGVFRLEKNVSQRGSKLIPAMYPGSYERESPRQSTQSNIGRKGWREEGEKEGGRKGGRQGGREGERRKGGKKVKKAARKQTKKQANKQFWSKK